jgi:hypothetical protein
MIGRRNCKADQDAQSKFDSHPCCSYSSIVMSHTIISDTSSVGIC